MATLITSISILLILLAKIGLKKHISARWQYKLDLLFFPLLAIPLVPCSFFSHLNWVNWPNAIQLENRIMTTVTVVEEAGQTYGMGWLQDFAVTVERSTPGYLSTIFIGIWIVGMIALVIFMLWHNRNLRLIKESVKPIEDKELLSLLSSCKAEIGVKGTILLGSSILVKTPMMVGLFKTLIILPAGNISLDHCRYALLHELAHYKNRDIKINGIMTLFQLLYWFNPLVYIISKRMHLDRELACDASVLETLPRKFHIAYGETLLNFVNRQSSSTVFFSVASMGGSKPQIVKRIKHIASYATEPVFSKAKSVCVFILMGLIVFLQIPMMAVLAGNDNDLFNFQADSVLYADFSNFFGDFDGSFVLYDLEAGVYTIHNRDMSVTRVSPNSTYKIFSALIALETGVLDANNTAQEWDGIVHPFEAWNQDQNLALAMQYSTNWYFQNMDAQVGVGELYRYLSQLVYGNTNLSGGIADFWIESSLRISPVEQVRVLRDFYQNNTVFEAAHVGTVKDALRLSESNGAVLSGKTGTGIVNGRFTNGWFIGYVENADGTFIFATYIQGEDTGGSVAAGITLEILEDKGIF